MLSLEATIERVERLAASGAMEDVRALVSMLGDEDWQARRAAAAAIVDVVRSERAEANIEPLFGELIAAASDKAHAGRRAAAIAALEGIGQHALPRLAAELQNATATARIALTGIIGNAGGAEAVRLLAPLTRDDDTNVAAAAIAALGRTGEPEAAQILLELIDVSDDWLRFAVVGALGELGDERAIEKLEQLLEEALMQEAVTAALVEIASVNALLALGRHLRGADGALRPVVLSALISLGCDERTAPLAFSSAIHQTARKVFREASDETTYDDLIKLMSTGEAGFARIYLTACGWLGDERAVPLIIRALDDPSLAKTARQALSEMANRPAALDAMLASEALPQHELAVALGRAASFPAIEVAIRLSVEAADAETLEASLTALAHGRNWLQRRLHAAPFSDGEIAHLENFLLNQIPLAYGRALLEIADTLGQLAPLFQPQAIEAIARNLSRMESEDYLMARLTFLRRADFRRALEEAAHAQRHPSAPVRMTAIQILSGPSDSASSGSLVLHLTDEAAGVRRAATRAMRNGAASAEAQLPLLACLVDEDIWVRAEAITTLGVLFGTSPQVHDRLHQLLDAAHPLCRVAAAGAIAPYATTKDWQALARMARRDALTEVRRAAMQAFTHCAQTRLTLRVARHALSDAKWSVRRAAVMTLAAEQDAASLKLLLGVAADQMETASVRGAALRALANRNAPETIKLACLAATQEADATLHEDAYAAMLSMARMHRSEMMRAAATCAPRGAGMMNFILNQTMPDYQE